MKALNLYAGIGGNRKLWDDVLPEIKVTAVEIDPEIAGIYHDYFPEDEIIIGDAHKFLLEHFREYDFIWSSPPCPTHSRMKMANIYNGKHKPVYPDMSLYQEIILLQYFAKGKWVIENVKSYYDPLIQPQELNRHYFWANFNISAEETKQDFTKIKDSIKLLEKFYGYDLSKYKLSSYKKRQVLRNCVHPEFGKHVLQCALQPQLQLF